MSQEYATWIFGASLKGDDHRAVFIALSTVLIAEVNRLRSRADLLLVEANRARQADGLAALTEAPLGTVTLIEFVEAVKRQL